MYKAIEALLNGDIVEFYTLRQAFSNYSILYSLANTTNDYKDEAQSLITRANAKEPMDFDLEAERLFLKILYASLG